MEEKEILIVSDDVTVEVSKSEFKIIDSEVTKATNEFDIITNKDLRDILSKYPDDAFIMLETDNGSVSSLYAGEMGAIEERDGYDSVYIEGLFKEEIFDGKQQSDFKKVILLKPRDMELQKGITIESKVINCIKAAGIFADKEVDKLFATLEPNDRRAMFNQIKSVSMTKIISLAKLFGLSHITIPTYDGNVECSF